jgi:biopolymer transport protein ExbD
MSRRIFRVSESRSIEEPAINLTPLIDVVFVILIMFIVVAPLLDLDRVELADAALAPNDKAISVQESSPITIHVRQDNTIAFNGQTVTIGQLTEKLKQAKKLHPKARPQLFHDKKAHFGTYQAIKNSAEAAGFQQMDIILKPA